MKMIEVKLPEYFDEVEVYALSDLHVGCQEFNETMFHNFVRHILEKPNRYIITNGDLMNNALKSSISNVYNETMSPSQQKRWLKDHLNPIKDRIMVMVGGNHEERSSKESDVDLTMDIAEYLGVPYSKNEAYLQIQLGKNTKGNRKPLCYGVYAVHGCGGGGRPGSALNRIENLSMNIFANVYIMGHVHKKMSYKAIYRQPDPQNKTIKEIEQLFIISGAWCNYGGYAARMMLRAGSLGASVFTLSGTRFEYKSII